MKPREIAIYLIAKELGVDFEFFKNDFNQRFKFQKLMFLAFQTSQFKDLGCQFGLYKHGPYSPDLTKIGYEISDSLKNLKDYSFNENGEKQVEKLHKKFPDRLLKIIKEKELKKKDSNIIEAFSTLVMLCKNFSLVDKKVSDHKELIIENFKNLKAIPFSKEELEQLFDEACDFLSLN